MKQIEPYDLVQWLPFTKPYIRSKNIKFIVKELSPIIDYDYAFIDLDGYKECRVYDMKFTGNGRYNRRLYFDRPILDISAFVEHL